MSASTITILFLIFAIVSFILEKIPLGLTATIVAIGLNVNGVLDASQTFSGYVNSNVILCVGMFVVGQALFETGMANKIGGVVTRFAKNEKILMVAIMVIVGVMSGFLSNTGTAAVLIPVVCGIADESGYSRSRLLMPLVFAAALGGNLSIIGAPGNLMGVDALQNLGEETGFFMYAPIGIPMLLAGIVYFVFIGYRLLPKTSAKSVAEVAETKPDFSHVPKWKKITSLVVLIAVILAMIFEKQIGIPIQVSACIGACVVVLTGVISGKAALKSIDLKVVLLFGGSLALANALDTSGAGTMIADTDRRISWKKSKSDDITACHICSVLCPDKLYVKHSNHSADGSNRGIYVRYPWGRSKSSGYCNGNCSILRLRNTNRNACKYHGSRTWRLYL